MARLGTGDRARLPDRAFAYIDGRGRRRLPIHDESHVRNALARFNQVAFDDERERDRALTKVLRAAKKYRIVPVGFIATRVRSERDLAVAQAGRRPELPSGFVTMLLTDIEGSTALVARLGDKYGGVLEGVQAILRTAALGCDGHVVEVRADELFAAFERPDDAVRMAVAVQRELGERSWPDGTEVRVRVGIHSGYPTRVEANYIGLAVHVAARVADAANGGQIVVSADTKTALTGCRLDGIRFRDLGQHRLRGIPEAVGLYQVAAKGLGARFPPLRTASASG